VVIPSPDEFLGDLTWRVDGRLDHHATGLRYAIGELQARLARALPPADARAAEFRVFSQWGEDGILQFLTQRVPLADRTFIEIGVESYRECNTRFLVMHDNWRGYAIDGSDDHVRWLLHESALGWQFDVTPLVAFVTAENINDVVAGCGIDDLDLLSLDIDGSDYWVLRALEVARPRILVVEYNSTFGPERAVSVPYASDFHHREAHPSGLYFGASLSAFHALAQDRGYELVATESKGANAFFVRRDVLGDLPALDPSSAWVASRFRSSRDEAGNLTYLGDHGDRLRLIADLPLVDTITGQQLAVGDLLAR
jgi:hypothetical protein